MDSSWREAAKVGSVGGKEDWRDYLPKEIPEEEQIPMQSAHADPVISVEPATAPDEFSEYGTTGMEAAQEVVDPNAPPSEEELLAAARERDATDRRREQMLGRGLSEHDYTSSAGFVIRDGVPMWSNPIAQPEAVIEEEDKYPGVSAKELIRRKEHGEDIPYSQILNEKKLDELSPIDRVFVQARATIGAATKYATLVPDYAEEGRKPPEVMSYEWLTDVLPKSMANFVIALPHFFVSAGDAGYQLGNILGRYIGDRVEKYQSGASARELSAIDAQFLDDLEKSYPAEFGKMMVDAITAYGGVKDVFTEEGRKFDYEVMKHAWRSEPALGIILLAGAGLKARRMARGEPGPIGRALDKMVVDRAKRYRDIRNHVRETLRNKFDEAPAGDREFNNWVNNLPEETRTKAIKDAIEPLKPLDVTELGEQGTYMGREYKTLGITEDGYARVVFASGEEGLIPVYYKWRGPSGWWVKKREIPKRFTKKRFIKNQPEMRGVRETDVTRKDGKPFTTRAATNRTRKLLKERGEGDYEPVQLGKGRWVLRKAEKVVEEAAGEKAKPRAAPKSRVEELTDHFYRDAEEARATIEKRADSPQLFLEQQIAAVNEWLRGEDVDISLVRENVRKMRESLGELARHLKMKADERKEIEKQLKLLEEWMEKTKDRRREGAKTEAPPEEGKIPDRERPVEEELEPSPEELKALEMELAEEGIIPEKAEELRVEREDLGPPTEAAPEIPPKAPADFRLSPEEVEVAEKAIADARQRHGATTENMTVTESVDSALLDVNRALNNADPAALIDSQTRLMQIVSLVDWTEGVNPKLLRYLRDVNRWAQEQKITQKTEELSKKETGMVLRSADPVGILLERAWKKLDKLREENKLALTLKREQDRKRFLDSLLDDARISKQMLEKAGPAARDAYNKLIISRGFTGESAWVVRIMDDTIYKPLSKRQRIALDEFLFLDRIVQLEEGPTKKKKYVHPQGITVEEARAARDHIAARFPDLTNKELETVILKAGQYHELMKGELKVLLDGGMITRDAYEKMLGLRYVRRRNLVDDIDPIHHYKFGDKTIAVHDSGISAAQIGRASDVLSLDSRELAIEVINRARGRKYKNNANQALARFAIDNPDNGFVSKKTRKGWQKITYYESGTKQSLWLRNDFAHGWVSATGPVSPYILNTLKFISGSNVLKTFATGVNPGFALRNLPRDLAHIWLVSQYMDANGKWVSTYSPNIFKAAVEMGRDLPKTLKEAWTKGDLFQEAAETGMMMEFMVHQARLFHEPSGLKGKMRTVYNVLSKLGEVSEVSTRLMLREQALRKIAKREGITIEEARANKSFAYEASTIARDYLDFGQYGSTTRVLDSMIPYLNAGIQGTRGVFRAASRNPAEFAAKAGQIMATAGLLYMLGSRLAPEIWDSIDQQKKMDNWIIPLPMLGYRRDEHGGKHYYYITIPKDNGQRFFATIAEAAMGNMMRDPETRVPKLENLAASFSSTLSPVDPSYMPLPPIVNAFAAMSGQDLRRLEALWRGKTVDIDEEYEVQFGARSGTHPFFQDLGKVGIPPQRLRGILESYFTGNNEVFAALGLGYKAVFHDVDFENADVRNILAKWPTTKGIIKETHPYTMFAKPLEEAQRKQSTQEKRAYRAVQEPLDKYLFRDGGPDSLAEAYTKAVEAYETSPALGDSLIDFIGISMITSKLPDRSLMMRLRALSPEARADGLWQVMKNLPEERRTELITQMLQTPGLFTERFLNRFMANQVEEE